MIICGADITEGGLPVHVASGDKRGKIGAVLHQHGYEALTRQTAACWDARSL
jgi:hypothetical protein